MRCAFAFPFVGIALAIPDVSSTLQYILKNTEGTNKYKYPTDFTRGILPVRVQKNAMMNLADVRRNLSTATTIIGMLHLYKIVVIVAGLTITGEMFHSTPVFPTVPYPPKQMSG